MIGWIHGFAVISILKVRWLGMDVAGFGSREAVSFAQTHTDLYSESQDDEVDSQHRTQACALLLAMPQYLGPMNL